MAEFGSSPVNGSGSGGDDGVGVFDDFDDFDASEASPTGTKNFFWSPSGERFWVTTDKIEKLPGPYEKGPAFRKVVAQL
ncbi:hypothetical protein O1611_g1362 [Lasiodiplodia mahajangana]|uniref:Uncharacterized protein n=1 Tax=Lasiodiplodia mahajangana TaxID=1108764 RepID=A0ACC2JYI7_9PEZI|nr:hypothetical protein O1611_g1362 [Lasiodiplodia mahajangana]